MRIWQTSDFPADVSLRARIGPLTLYLRRHGDEWQIATVESAEDDFPGDQPPTVTDELPDDLSWTRWVVGEADKLQLRPVMPDKPLVVRPEASLKIPPGRAATFFVSIPISIRVNAGHEPPLNLVEVPTQTMSRIWFGDPMSGELCYTLHTRARRELDDQDIRPHRAVCAVWVKNESATELSLERLMLHVQHLAVYDSPKQLWTGGVQVRFRGDEQIAQVTFDEQPPEHEPVGKRLSEARQALPRNLLKRTFGNFKFPWG